MRAANCGAMMRFVYCYQMKEDPGGAQDIAPKHVAYWHQVGLPAYIDGPFEDRSGELIRFDVTTDQ